LMVIKPNNIGINQFHNHITGNPRTKPVHAIVTTSNRAPPRIPSISLPALLAIRLLLI